MSDMCHMSGGGGAQRGGDQNMSDGLIYPVTNILNKCRNAFFEKKSVCQQFAIYQNRKREDNFCVVNLLRQTPLFLNFCVKTA